MKVRPLHDRIIVQRLDEGEQKIGGIIIPDTAKEKSQQGKVVAKRPGKRRYVMAWDQIPGFDQSSAEVGVQSTPPPVDERRADMRHDRAHEDRWDDYRANLLVPRENPESWRNEPHESIPGVPEGSKLIGIPIPALESQYDVRIEVLEGDHDILKAHSGLHVQGLGAAVLNFFKDLRST